MSWLIKCGNAKCGLDSRANNIIDLISSHRNKDGWFICQHCRMRGYIFKKFDLQEVGKTWEPFLRGIIMLGRRGRTYQPFIFLVSYRASGPANNFWFSYYKDLRASGGRLKLGYGPGGPPVLDHGNILRLLRRLRQIGCLSGVSIRRTLK